MTKVHLWANRKGGVGKSTLCVHVASQVNRWILGDPGKKTSRTDRSPAVLVASIDPQHSIDSWVKAIEARGVEAPFDYAMIGDAATLAAVRSLGHDHVFIDSAGNLEDPLLHAAIREADDVFIPMDCTALAIEPTIATVETVQAAGKPFHIVLNNYSPSDPTEADHFAAFVLAQGWPLAPTQVRRYKLHARGALEGTTVIDYKQNVTANSARNDIKDLCGNLGLSAGPHHGKTN